MRASIPILLLASGLLAVGVALRWSGPAIPADAAAAAVTPVGMVYVPSGWFTMGSTDPDASDDVRPARRVYLPGFYIDRTEVTNAQYRRFRPRHTFPPGEEDLPVTGVTYDEAEAYARWAGKRLPTEEEWEKAARGADGRRYPWGSEWNSGRVAQRRIQPAGSPPGNPQSCALRPSRVQPVGSVPGGASPCGALDMAGNAWEWVQGFFRGNPAQRILRGGAVGYGERAHRAYERGIEGAAAT